MKKLLLALSILAISTPALALEISYPASTTPTINSKSTFFIGNTDISKPLTINNSPVNVHKSGNFAHVVDLKEKVNTFVIKSGEEVKTYTITKTSTVSTPAPKCSSFYTKEKSGIVKNDNSPLRSSPLDFGINRLSHLNKGTPLVITGEEGSFYKIKLAPDTYGYISLSQVEILDKITPPAKILNFSSKETNEFDIYEFELDRKVPYSISENPFSITLFNIDNNDGFFTFSPFYNNKKLGFSTEFQDNKFVCKIRKYPKINKNHPLKNIKIAIDAGHGGNESGAKGCSGILEKDLNLKISNKLAQELANHGAKVIKIRNDDSFISLSDRVKIANENDAMIFISIHANALPDNQNPNEHSGTSIYYYYDQAKPLANSVLNNMIISSGTNNDKVRQQSFAVVRNTNALSILIETGYLINPNDNWMLEQENYQNKLVEGIIKGIEEFLVLY